uniref:DNA-directed RNA polymerase n=1 Tax=Nitzschia alba TaxID=2858 RepID=A0A5C0F4S1_NITAL|nr:DNA-directed RNA polymerase beta chain [Nitzschia alba]QEI59560.1 DNA-directed RNA polymerase beta chain [Nitzschia alba]
MYINTLVGKKQIHQLLSWSFHTHNLLGSCLLAEKLKILGFQYASQAGISLSIEDLRIPFTKYYNFQNIYKKIKIVENLYLKGKITEVERFQKIISLWNYTSNSLKNQAVYFFNNYDPLNSIYIMSSSGARGNLAQVRQLIGMRGLMANPSGQIIDLPIKQNFQEGLTITDYLISGYGARKGVIDTALKTANSGYLTRRLIDVAQDIIIRDKDCFTKHSLLIFISKLKYYEDIIVGRILAKTVFNNKKNIILAQKDSQITSKLVKAFRENKVLQLYIRSPLVCNLYRALCQKCYGWNLTNETLIDIGETIGILAGQSVGEPGTQLTMRTFHTGGTFTSNTRQQIICPINGIIKFNKTLKYINLRTNCGEDIAFTKNSGSLIIIPQQKFEKLIEFKISKNTLLFPKNNQYILKNTAIGELIKTHNQGIIQKQPLISDISGEIFIPKQNKNLINKHQLFWILAGQFYICPANSFINYYLDAKVNKDSYIFRSKLVNNLNSFINIQNKEKYFEITSNKYFKTQGIINIKINFYLDEFGFKNKIITLINKSGLSYIINAKNPLSFERIYYPGEYIFSIIPINTLSLCECFTENNITKLLIRPIEIYELPHFKIIPNTFYLKDNTTSSIKIIPKLLYRVESGTSIYGLKSFNLISSNLNFNLNYINNKEIKCKWVNKSSLIFKFINNINLINYILPEVKYTKPNFCFLTQNTQYVNTYTILGYLETIALNPFEIIKIKIKKQINKQLLILSNKDSFVVEKIKLPKNKINDFISLKDPKLKAGKIIFENNKNFIIQKGQPYFIPNCEKEKKFDQTKFKYKIFPLTHIPIDYQTNKQVFLNYYNIKNFYLKNRNFEKSIKIELSKLFLKNEEQLYNCSIPQFYKIFSINSHNLELFTKKELSISLFQKQDLFQKNRIILLNNINNTSKINKIKDSNTNNLQLTILKMINPRPRFSIGLYTIMDEFYKQEINYLFCKNKDFIPERKLIGLLNIEKEITSDIVQGLPKIDEILEARKKGIIIGNTNIKRGFLTQRTSLDNNFEFKKIGLPIKKWNLKNPHKILQIYFNYYGLIRYFLSTQQKKLKFKRLATNYEAIYKSFKKIQLLILNLIQEVYKSQGVNIHNKHLEIIIKQMTTKVIITQAGQTSLFKYELVDFYHIKYINKIINPPAIYVPLILGITRSALNNPSFLSSASFQKTTDVLSKAAIEGQIDWLRGLKENIIVGNFIPAGTALLNYKEAFIKKKHNLKLYHLLYSHYLSTL